MRCPHCDKEITEIDEIVNKALRAACPDEPFEQVKYTSEEVGLSAQGTFIVGGELREFFMVFDDYRRLIRFTQNKKQ